MTDAELGIMRELGAVGDIGFRYYDADGALVRSGLDERVMGISAEQFFGIPRRIGVAGGAAKFQAIRGAARGGWINVLITDRDSARRLVEDADS